VTKYHDNVLRGDEVPSVQVQDSSLAEQELRLLGKHRRMRMYKGSIGMN
jgi:hypothetical protein